MQKKQIRIVALFSAACFLIGIPQIINMQNISPKEYMITTSNNFDYQLRYECSGYASAYVLRSLGVKANGLEFYQKISNKNDDGSVSPETLCNFLKEEGYHAAVHHGTVNQLKRKISKGVPVIVLIRTYVNQDSYHYIPLVGYDENNFYAADSLRYLVNEDEPYYNRRIDIEEFKKLWKTFETNLSITINN